jgi:hypothetical protein
VAIVRRRGARWQEDRRLAAGPLRRRHRPIAGAAWLPWFLTRSADKDAITTVSVARTVLGVWCVRFNDSSQHLADTHIHLPFRGQRIIDELRQCGYAVIDRKTGQPVVRLPKR